MCSIIIMSDVDPQMAVAPCTMLALIQDPARISSRPCSRVAQWKRAGPITQRSLDRNQLMRTRWCQPKTFTPSAIVQWLVFPPVITGSPRETRVQFPVAEYVCMFLHHITSFLTRAPTGLFTGFDSRLVDEFGHTRQTAPHPVRSAKLSCLRRGQQYGS